MVFLQIFWSIYLPPAILLVSLAGCSIKSAWRKVEEAKVAVHHAQPDRRPW